MSEAVPMQIDLTTLLQPISAREPAGEWLRYEGTYDAVQDARREEDESLPKGIWTSKPKRADWAKVDALCQKALRERTKDLQLAVWLAEAWLQLHGPRGFARGLALCYELLDRFWDSLYPILDDGDTAYRLAPLEFLDRKVALRLKQLPLTKAAEKDLPALSFADWEQALHNQKHSEPGTSTVLLPAQFLSAAAATPTADLGALKASLQELQEAAVAVEAAVARHTGEPGSILRGLRALITEILVLITPYIPEDQAAVPGERAAADPLTTAPAESSRAAAPPAAPDGTQAAAAPAGSEAAAGPIRSRVEAFRRLAEAADYLLHTEPHSPVPYLVKRAISWGNMNLMQLLTELVGNDSERTAIAALLGIRASNQGQGS